MATILYADGRQEERQPENGIHFRLNELQAIIGGLIELVSTREGQIMVINEEGKLIGLPRNEQATSLIDYPSPDELRAMLAANPEIIFVGDLDEADYIAGDVLVCRSDEIH